jgi:anti-sigma factor RsiW
MAQLAETPHVGNFIADYTLGLLPEEEEKSVAAHLRWCQDCRQAWISEQSVTRALRDTLLKAPIADPARIRHLMPAPPVKSRPQRRVFALKPGIAAAAAIFVILFASLAIFSVQESGPWTFSAPTNGSTEVILTNTPTLTATAEVTVTSGTDEPGRMPDSTASTALGKHSLLVPAPASVPVPATSLLGQ